MSPEPDGDPNPLIGLFRRCVVCITDEQGRFRGSGFFVAPGQVVTCGHVAHGAAALRLRWQDQTALVNGVAAAPPLGQVADPASYPLPDLAVLDAVEAAEWGHPCVALTAEQPVLSGRDGLYLAGYTVEHGPAAALTGATTEFESLVSEDGHTFYKLKRGLLLPGFSGSPLLDLRTGLVAGIVESSRGRQADLGGFAVPAAELEAAFPGLLEANRAFRDGDNRWKTAAEAEKLQAAERAGARGRLPSADELPLAGGPALARLVELPLVGGRLPRVSALDPYTLGATKSEYGNAETYGQRDEYVPRKKDEPLAAALRPGRLTVLVGPSKTGKTRTAFQVMRSHEDWCNALLAAPVPESLEQLAGHPTLSDSEPLVIWLDDLHRFLPPAGELSQATISRLANRPGPTVLIATLRTEQRELLRGPEGELTREVRMVLDNATSIELASIRDDPDEQARAATTYPDAASRPEGLTEILAGAPELLRRYHDAATTQPPLHILVQTCID